MQIIYWLLLAVMLVGIIGAVVPAIPGSSLILDFGLSTRVHLVEKELLVIAFSAPSVAIIVQIGIRLRKFTFNIDLSDRIKKFDLVGKFRIPARSNR